MLVCTSGCSIICNLYLLPCVRNTPSFVSFLCAHCFRGAINVKFEVGIQVSKICIISGRLESFVLNYIPNWHPVICPAMFVPVSALTSASSLQPALLSSVAGAVCRNVLFLHSSRQLLGIVLCHAPCDTAIVSCRSHSDWLAPRMCIRPGASRYQGRGSDCCGGVHCAGWSCISVSEKH